MDDRLSRAGAALFEWFIEGRNSDDVFTEELVTRLAKKHDLTETEVYQAIRMWKERTGQAQPAPTHGYG